MNPQMSNQNTSKPGSIQSVLRSYGGPSHSETAHKDQLKQQLLRSDFFAEPAEAAGPQKSNRVRPVAFTWTGVLQRLAVASVPAVAFVVILALVVGNFSPLTAQKVLAKAADNLEAQTGQGRVHYTKTKMTTDYEGVTDRYNSTIVETWIDTQNFAMRTTVHTEDGALLQDVAQIDQKTYECSDCLASNLSDGIIVEGPLVEPGGPIEKKIAQAEAEAASDPSALGIGGGGEMLQTTSAACVEGVTDCPDVIQIPLDSGFVSNLLAPGVVGATPGGTDEEVIGGLYGIQFMTDPAERAKILRDLSSSPRISYKGKINWRGHEVESVSVVYWTSTQHDTFYFDSKSFELVGMETSFRGGLGAASNFLTQHMTTEVLETRFSDDANEINANGLEQYQDPALLQIQRGVQEQVVQPPFEIQ